MSKLPLMIASLILLAGCGGGGGGGGITPPPADPKLYVINPENRLTTFKLSAPTTAAASVLITGILGGAVLFSIDFRVSDKKLIGLDDNNQIYAIDPTTAVATPIGDPIDVLAPGDPKQIEWDPVSGNIRLITQLNVNLRINPTDGTVLGTDTDLEYASGDINALETPNIAAFAHSKSTTGSTTTTLFGIDGSTDALTRIGGPDGTPSPNAGSVATIGQLGIDIDLYAGFDILSTSAGEFAYVTNNVSFDPVINPFGEFKNNLYSVNLTTGATTLIGVIANGDNVQDLAVAP
ncbi:MAG: DUF4394 domain-containing protein [Armatimonadetes bacterium]|nr:DUF4394 domain-containing protein [Armatimonadota bacterium]